MYSKDGGIELASKCNEERRYFTKQLSLACLCLTTLTADALGATVQQKRKNVTTELQLAEVITRQIRTLTRSRFAAVLNDNFETTYGAGDIYILQLVEVADLPMPAPAHGGKKKRVLEEAGEREKSFVLRFRGAFEMPLPQKLYTLRHPLLGEHEIFLVPVDLPKKENGARFYEAVFNRHIE